MQRRAVAARALDVHINHVLLLMRSRDAMLRRGCSPRQVAAAVLPQAPKVSATRAPPEHMRPPADAAPVGSAVTVVPRRESRWQKQWQDMRSQARPAAPTRGAPCANWRLCTLSTQNYSPRDQPCRSVIPGLPLCPPACVSSAVRHALSLCP